MGIVSEKTVMPTYTIYKITVLDRVYIGKTINFKNRTSDHISNCHNKNTKQYNIPLYKYIRELEDKGEFKFNESHFEIIEENTDYEDEEDILHMEKAWFEFYRDELKIEMLNDRRPILTEEERKEYGQAYKQTEKYKKQQKAYEQRPENRERHNRLKRERRAKKRAERQAQNQS